MKIQDIINSSKYLTDNIIDLSMALPMLNSCIAKINTTVGTNLPFLTSETITADYDAISVSWQSALFEPYLAYSISSNEVDENLMSYYYNRFLVALNDFKNRGLKDIKSVDEAGNDTGYAGKSARVVKIDGSNRTLHFYGNDW